MQGISLKLLMIIIAVLGCATLGLVGTTAGSITEASGSFGALTAVESKTQPKKVILAKDSQSDKYGEAAFDHETHSLKNYSPDGKSVISCVECHHTDQPKADLKAPYVTSERNAVLTTALLATADSAAVKTCRTCHLQAGDDSAPLPTSINPDTKKTVKLNNELAYHINCNTCHDSAIKARPELKGKIPGTNDCAICHKPIG